jgi:hypothetical protein
MIKQLIFSFIAFTTLLNSVNAQKANQLTDEPKDKRFEHYVGVQINPLLRQLLTIGTMPSVNNPFLLNYSLNNAKSRWGIHAGVGFNFIQLKNNDDITDRKTMITNVSSRIGLDRYFDLSPRWQVGFGIDGIYQLSENITNTQVVSFDTIDVENRLTTQRSGGGLRGFARFKLSERIMLGTESTLYYQFGFNKIESKVTSRDFNQPGAPKVTVSTSNVEQLIESQFSLPVVIYLAFKF